MRSFSRSRQYLCDIKRGTNTTECCKTNRLKRAFSSLKISRFNLHFEQLLKQVLEAVKDGTCKELEQLTREFNTPVQKIVRTQWVNSNCSDIMFINLTPLTVIVNGNIQINNYVLQPGGFVGFMGNNAEINVDTYNVVFDSAATSCVVLKKLYTKKK